MQVWIRTGHTISIPYFDPDAAKSVAAGEPPVTVTLQPRGGPAGRGEATIAELVDAPSDVVEALNVHPGDGPWGRRSPIVEAFVAPIEERHRSVVASVVELARWRLGGHSDHRAVIGGSTEWSADGQEWRPIPRDMRPHATVTLVEALPVGSIESLARHGVHEPVGHALLREARENIHENPRSALVVGVAALEVGLKEAIADLDHVAGWLAQKAPTPPLERMLRDLIPLLPARIPADWRVQVPPPMLKSVREAVTARNDIVHVGAPGYVREDLEAFLEVVNDLLYMLDCCRGQTWAFDRIQSLELRAAMRPSDYTLALGRPGPTGR